MAGGGDGGIYTSTNSGATWVKASAPTADWSALAASADGYRAVAACNGGVYYAFSLGANPLLSIGLSGADPRVSWLVPSAGFALQQNSDLSSANWLDVTNQPTLNFTNLHYEVTFPQTSGNAFYRLKLQ
jgi:hypothetical protein